MATDPAFRVSFFFQQQAELLGGWTENFWSHTDQLSVVTARSTELVDLLNNIKGLQTVPTAIRISDATLPSPTFRDVLQIPLKYSTSPDQASAAASDYFNTAALIKLTGAGNYVVHTWYRSLGDNVVKRGGRYDPPASFVTDINKVFAHLTTGANLWSLRVQNKAVPKKFIESVTQLGVVTITAHGYTSGDKVRISRMITPATGNKIYRVVVLTVNTFQLVGWTDPGYVPVPGQTSTAQLQSQQYVNIVKAEVVRATAHRTGRPSGLLGGRRRRRR